MSNENTDQRVCAAAGQNQIERQQHPWQIHGLKTCAKPEIYDHIFV